MKVAEERKRPFRAPFLAHEQERRHRRQQRDGKRGRHRGLVDLGGQAVAERTVADLIVVLQEIDERGRGQGAGRFAAPAAVAMRGRFALIRKARCQDPRQTRAGVGRIILVIARALAGQEHVPGVVIVVVPLRAILSARRVDAGIEQAHAVVVVFQHQMDRAAARGRQIAGRRAQFTQQHGLAGLGDCVNRIEPQAVEPVLLEPVQRIFNREGADLRDTIVDRLAPRRLRRHVEPGRIAGQIVTFRPEMIVDDVEKHHQPAQMRFVDQRLQVFGPAIGAVRRIQQHAVVTPVAPAGEIGDRH